MVESGMKKAWSVMLAITAIGSFIDVIRRFAGWLNMLNTETFLEALLFLTFAVSLYMVVREKIAEFKAQYGNLLTKLEGMVTKDDFGIKLGEINKRIESGEANTFKAYEVIMNRLEKLEYPERFKK